MKEERGERAKKTEERRRSRGKRNEKRARKIKQKTNEEEQREGGNWKGKEERSCEGKNAMVGWEGGGRHGANDGADSINEPKDAQGRGMPEVYIVRELRHPTEPLTKAFMIFLFSRQTKKREE